MAADDYPEDWQEQGWCCRPCAVAAWRAAPGARPLPDVTVNPDELLERMLRRAGWLDRNGGTPDAMTAAHAQALAADVLVFHRLMLERLPWPTIWEERRVEDVPLDGPGGLPSAP